MRFDRARLVEAALLVVVASGAAWVGFTSADPPVEERLLAPPLMEASANEVLLVTVFDDFECPACARFDSRVAPRLHELEAAGRIRLRYRHTPLATHDISRVAAAGVACAGGHPSARRTLHHDRSWISASDPATAVARALNPDHVEALLTCMSGGTVQDALAADAELGRRAEIHRVPTVWVGNSHVTFRSYRSLLRYINRRLDG